MFADGLAIETRTTRNGLDRQPFVLELLDHNDLPELEHRDLPAGNQIGRRRVGGLRTFRQGRAWRRASPFDLSGGEFYFGAFGEFCTGVDKVYLQTVLDTFSRYAWGLLHTSKMPVTAVQTLNNAVLPFFDQHGITITTILSDNGREYCGRPDQHPYELFLQLEQIEHRTTKVRRPQSNGFIERLHRTLLDEHFRLKGREKFYESVAEMQVDLEAYLVIYNTKRPHQGRGMNGMTPLQAFEKGLKLRPKTEPKAEPEEAA